MNFSGTYDVTGSLRIDVGQEDAAEVDRCNGPGKGALLGGQVALEWPRGRGLEGPMQTCGGCASLSCESP